MLNSLLHWWDFGWSFYNLETVSEAWNIFERSLVSHRRESERAGIDFSDGCYSLEGCVVQITPLPLPASSFNFSSKEKGFTFFGLKSFLVTGSYGALWLCVVPTKGKPCYFPCFHFISCFVSGGCMRVGGSWSPLCDCVCVCFCLGVFICECLAQSCLIVVSLDDWYVSPREFKIFISQSKLSRGYWSCIVCFSIYSIKHEKKVLWTFFLHKSVIICKL